MSGFHQSVVHPSSTKTIEKRDHTRELHKSGESDSACADILSERNSGVDNVHKVTILNLPHGDGNLKNKACNRNEGCIEDRLVYSSVDHVKEKLKFASGELCLPILPWINGDGTINSIVYNGLRRRVLGVVMQNPGILEVYSIFITVPRFNKFKS